MSVGHVGVRDVGGCAEQPDEGDGRQRLRGEQGDEDDELEPGRVGGARAAEQGADEGARQRDQPDCAGLVDGGQQGFLDGGAGEVRDRLAWGGAEREPGLDFVAAAHHRLVQSPTRQGAGGHGAADHDAAGRDQIARGPVEQRDAEDDPERDGRAGRAGGKHGPSGVGEAGEPARRGQGRYGEHHDEDCDRCRGCGEHPAQRQADEGELGAGPNRGDDHRPA